MEIWIGCPCNLGQQHKYTNCRYSDNVQKSTRTNISIKGCRHNGKLSTFTPADASPWVPPSKFDMGFQTRYWGYKRVNKRKSKLQQLRGLKPQARKESVRLRQYYMLFYSLASSLLIKRILLAGWRTDAKVSFSIEDNIEVLMKFPSS